MRRARLCWPLSTGRYASLDVDRRRHRRQFYWPTTMSTAVFLIVSCFCCLLHAAVPHSVNVQKERESDGGGGGHQHQHHREHIMANDSGPTDEHMRMHFDHEAILGSREAAEEFDRLPADEAKRRLRVLATSSMDVDGDGHVDREELIRWILKSFKMLNEEDTEERHDESDTDNDGFVTWHEYVDENYGIDVSNDQSLSSKLLDGEDGKMLLEDKELFAASDLDGDGRLTKSEFSSFAHPEEFEHTGRVLLKRAMEEKDLDGDGFLTVEEYLGGDAKGKDKEWMSVEKNRFDEDYDMDGNGRLNEDEVLAWLTPDDRYSAEQEADHLINTADDDLDGSLTIQEIADHHEAFVGSEATNFGQHLRLENPNEDAGFKEEL